MAVQLTPYIQDEQKWAKHYMSSAMKQLRPKEMTKEYKEKTIVKPSIVLPTSQLVEQAKSEMKREKHQTEIYAPVKIEPHLENLSSSASTGKQSTRKWKASSTEHKQSKKPNRKKDVFD